VAQIAMMMKTQAMPPLKIAASHELKQAKAMTAAL
jgi:hypothetical protein